MTGNKKLVMARMEALALELGYSELAGTDALPGMRPIRLLIQNCFKKAGDDADEPTVIKFFISELNEELSKLMRPDLPHMQACKTGARQRSVLRCIAAMNYPDKVKLDATDRDTIRGLLWRLLDGEDIRTHLGIKRKRGAPKGGGEESFPEKMLACHYWTLRREPLRNRDKVARQIVASAWGRTTVQVYKLAKKHQDAFTRMPFMTHESEEHKLEWYNKLAGLAKR